LIRTFIATLSLLAAAPAFASAATLFHDGHFPEAATAGRAENTAASLILAGRADLIEASFDTIERDRAVALINSADHDFDAALALAPTSLEAALMKAQAVGYRGKMARSPGLAKETRTRIEAVLARDPNYGLAWSSLAGWHAAGVATLGKFIAGTLLGANIKVAVADFETALAKDPKNPVEYAFYGLTLLDLGIDTPRATQLLETVARMPPRDAYEALLKRETGQVLPLLASGDVKGAQALARRLLPFGKLA
jgi:tetratricopeptide (TPR) repeat protein